MNFHIVRPPPPKSLESICRALVFGCATIIKWYMQDFTKKINMEIAMLHQHTSHIFSDEVYFFP